MRSKSLSGLATLQAMAPGRLWRRPAKLIRAEQSKETSGGSGATRGRIEGPGSSLGVTGNVCCASGHGEALCCAQTEANLQVQYLTVLKKKKRVRSEWPSFHLVVCTRAIPRENASRKLLFWASGLDACLSSLLSSLALLALSKHAHPP